MRMLPIFRIMDKYYFMDDMLQEFRNVKDPGDIIKFSDYMKSLAHDIRLEFESLNDEADMREGRLNYLEIKTVHAPFEVKF